MQIAPKLPQHNLIASGRSLGVFNQRATMPESHKAEKKRMQKANREAGIGDESGRIVRVKDEKPKGRCTVCQQEIVFTRTNTEAKAHAEGKHGSTMDVW